MDRDRRPLSPEERLRLLAPGGSSLLGIGLEREKLDGLDLLRVTWSSVALIDSDLVGATIADSRWQGVKCERTDLTGVVFTRVIFDTCTFQATGLGGARFVDCQFTHCRLDGIQGEKTSFHQVSFVDCDLHELRLSRPSMTGLTFNRSHLDVVEIDRAADGATLQFDHATMAQFRLTGGNFSRLMFGECTLANGVVNRATIEDLEVRGGKVGDVMFAGCGGRTWLVQAATASDTTVNSCGVAVMRIVDSAMTGLTILDARIDSLKLERSIVSASHWLANEIPGDLTIDRSTLQDLTIRKGHYRIRFADATIERHFGVTLATFEIVSEAVRLAPGAEVRLSQVTYHGPGRLPEPSA